MAVVRDDELVRDLVTDGLASAAPPQHVELYCRDLFENDIEFGNDAEVTKEIAEGEARDVAVLVAPSRGAQQSALSRSTHEQ